MAKITIELADRIDDGNCPCCGRKTTTLTRFVYADGDAHGVYYAGFTDEHPDRIVSVALSLGEWGEGSEAKDRVAFALRIRAAAYGNEHFLEDLMRRLHPGSLKGDPDTVSLCLHGDHGGIEHDRRQRLFQTPGEDVDQIAIDPG